MIRPGDSELQRRAAGWAGRGLRARRATRGPVPRPGRCGAGWSGRCGASRRPVPRRLRRERGPRPRCARGRSWRDAGGQTERSQGLRRRSVASASAADGCWCQARVRWSCSSTIASAESILKSSFRRQEAGSGCSVYGRTILTWSPSREPAQRLKRDAGCDDKSTMRSGPIGRGPMLDSTERFLCIASYEKGHDFLRQCAEMGVRPTLLDAWTSCAMRDWPREALEDLATMPAGLTREQILNTVSWMARGRRFDRIVALDEFDLETAAQIREHMRIPGMGTTTAGCYRDKLAMRVIARASRASWFRSSAACLTTTNCATTWSACPRRGCSSRGQKRPHWEFARSRSRSSCGATLEDLGDRQSHYLLEQFVPGDIFSRGLDRERVRSDVLRCASVRPAAHAGNARGRGVHHPHGGPREPRLEGTDRPERRAWRHRWAWCAA